jgi:hypothetical protein
MFSHSVMVDMTSIQPAGDGAPSQEHSPAHPFTVFRPDDTERVGGDNSTTDGRARSPRRTREAFGLGTAESMTLSNLYWQWFRPKFLIGLRGSDPDTVSLYDDSIGYWARLTDDPLLAEIDDFTVGEFMQRLAGQPGRRDACLSPLTCKKHGRNLNAILRRAGPRTRGIVGCLGLLTEVPYFELPPWHGTPRTLDFSLDELRDALARCDCMSTPRDCDPVTWWRGFILFAYHTALRIDAMMHVRWEHVQPNRWIDVPGNIQKGDRGIRVPIHDDAWEAIQRLPHRAGPVFPWPKVDNHGIGNLRSRWKRLLRIAGLPDARRFGFHGIRKAAANAVCQVDKIGPIAAEYLLGHVTQVTKLHYYNRERILSQGVAGMERIVS